MYKRISLIIFIILLSGGFVWKEAAAVESEATAILAPDSKVKLYFSKNTYTVYYGSSKNIVAKVKNSNKKLSITYVSENRDIASVDNNGNVKGRRVGKTTITAKAKNDSTIFAQCTVVINKEKKGLHTTTSGNKYYVKGNGLRKSGFTNVGKSSYYFAGKKSYAVKNKWKYVKINGKKYKIYFGKNGKRQMDLTNKMNRRTRYLLDVNLSMNMIVVYAKDGNNGYIIPVRAMICSGGMAGHRTKTGTYYSLSRAGTWHVLRYNSHGRYCTRYSGPYLFHSVTYDRYGDKYSLQKKEYEKLGKAASHGCIRLQVRDAKWIYDNCSRMRASIYYGGKKKTPLQKPKKEKIGKTSDGRYFDRTF